MLSVEEIKKACEYTQDFICYHSNSIFMIQYMKGSFNPKFSEGDTETATLWKDTYYPLFLQRVVEGINEKRNNDDDFKIHIRQDFTGIYCLNSLTSKIELWGANTDQAKEQSIKYILEKLK